MGHRYQELSLFQNQDTLLFIKITSFMSEQVRIPSHLILTECYSKISNLNKSIILVHKDFAISEKCQKKKKVIWCQLIKA